MIKEYQTINGNLRIKRIENVVIAEFSGAVDRKIIGYFDAAIKELLTPIAGQAWGYVSCSKDCQAATPEAEEMLIQSTLSGWQMGCVTGAYVLDSKVAINQTDRVLKRAGLESGLEDKLFEDLSQAMSYVREQLIKLTT